MFLYSLPKMYELRNNAFQMGTTRVVNKEIHPKKHINKIILTGHEIVFISLHSAENPVTCHEQCKKCSSSSSKHREKRSKIYHPLCVGVPLPPCLQSVASCPSPHFLCDHDHTGHYISTSATIQAQPLPTPLT